MKSYAAVMQIALHSTCRISNFCQQQWPHYCLYRRHKSLFQEVKDHNGETHALKSQNSLLPVFYLQFTMSHYSAQNWAINIHLKGIVSFPSISLTSYVTPNFFHLHVSLFALLMICIYRLKIVLMIGNFNQLFQISGRFFSVNILLRRNLD